MNLGEAEIWDLIQTIWRQVLDLDIERDHDDTPLQTAYGLMTACVNITGSWEGAVAIYCTSAFAREAAAVAFGLEQDQVEFEEMQDILGELANITGGNIKSLLPGSCQLSLPSVIEGRDYRFGVLGSQLRAQLRLRCLGEPVHVAFMQKDPNSPKRDAES